MSPHKKQVLVPLTTPPLGQKPHNINTLTLSTEYVKCEYIPWCPAEIFCLPACSADSSASLHARTPVWTGHERTLQNLIGIYHPYQNSMPENKQKQSLWALKTQTALTYEHRGEKMRITSLALKGLSYHREINIRGIQLQVYLSVDGSLAVLVEVLSDLRTHFCVNYNKE